MGPQLMLFEGSISGQLLSAIGRDGNDNKYPISLAAVEDEMYDSRKWFLNEFRLDIGIHNGAPKDGITIVGATCYVPVAAIASASAGTGTFAAAGIRNVGRKGHDKRSFSAASTDTRGRGAVAGIVSRGSVARSSRLGGDTGEGIEVFGSGTVVKDGDGTMAKGW
ncbi:hypothetical protein ACH5RR_018563 [Cinchona calisaya]|uniref:Uncharacterized protein n=1 Tax=Cinchona calisaya TaxID=153742 RepID=A0ABD2ZMP5_9GENT